MSSSLIHVAPFGALRFGFSQPRVCTRGYNMSSRWDYSRLKARLQTHPIKNVTLGAKGDNLLARLSGFHNTTAGELAKGPQPSSRNGTQRSGSYQTDSD